MISPSLGFFEKSGIVTYLHCGVPIFSHSSEDHPAFHYITSKFILEGLCSRREVSEAFDVSVGNVSLQAKKLADKGEAAFFGRDGRQGHGHKLTGAKLEEAQGCLDSGMSQNATAKRVGVREGTIRYALGTGKLKKKPPPH